jgi:hypothetical protein
VRPFPNNQRRPVAGLDHRRLGRSLGTQRRELFYEAPAGDMIRCR